MKQTDVITIKKVLSNYFTEDMTETLLEEIIEHTDTDIDDLPKVKLSNEYGCFKGGYQAPNSAHDVSELYPVQMPSLRDVVIAQCFLASTAQGLIEDAERADAMANERDGDLDGGAMFARFAQSNREDAESLLKVRSWLDVHNFDGMEG